MSPGFPSLSTQNSQTLHFYAQHALWNNKKEKASFFPAVLQMVLCHASMFHPIHREDKDYDRGKEGYRRGNNFDFRNQH